MENNLSLNKTVKSGIWYTISNFIVKSMGLITTPIFTRLLTQAEYGDYSNYLAWQNILVILVSLNLEASLISAKYDYKNFDNYVYSVLTLSSLSALIWGVVLNIFYSLVVGITSLDRIQLNCMLVYMFFYPVLHLFLTRERYLYNYVSNVILSIGYAIGTSGLSVILVVSMTNGLMGRILGNVIPTALIGIILIAYLLKKGGDKIDISCWRYALPIVLPYIPHLLSMTVLGSTDRIMIKNICGSDDAALYSLAYSCGTIISLLITSMNNAYAPWLAEKLNSNDVKSVRKFSYIYISGFSILALGLMLITPEVLYIMGGQSYMSAIYVMPPVAMGCVCQFLYTMFVNIEQISKNTFWMALASASAAIVNFFLNLLLIPKFGYMVAAYTTLVGYLWLLIMHMLIVYKMKKSSVYDYRFTFFIVIIMNAFTIVVSFLYAHTIIRWSIIGVAVLVAVILVIKYRKEISGMFFKGKEEKN